MEKGRHLWIILLLCALLLAILPLLAPPFTIYLFNEILIAALFGYGFYILFSHAGYLSFGQAAYYALGAYSVALMYKFVSNSTWLAFLSAIVVSGVVALILGFFCVRLGKLYFAFLTMGFAQMIYTIVFRWRSFTGGDDGLPGVPRGFLDFYFFKIPLESSVNYYYFTLAVFVVLVFITRKLLKSCFGLTLRSIRENIDRTGFVGINAHNYALIAFVISGIYCGIAGALHVSLTKMAYPELSYWSTSADPVIIILIGGIYSFLGPFVGAIIYVLLKTYLMTLIGNWVLFMGIVLLVMVLFFRSGIVGTVQKRFGVEL